MNLATYPWIPLIDLHGIACMGSLEDVLCRGTAYRDFAVRPHERVALMRFLLCLIHAALEGPSSRDWRNVPERLPEAAARYLTKWNDSFELFHPTTPFLQIAGLKPPVKSKKATSCDKPCGDADSSDADDGPTAKTSKLDFALATGSNSTLFDHGALGNARPDSPERLALLLLTYQNFSPGGLIGSLMWGGGTTPRTSSDAPCAVGSMLHSFWRGANVLETLHVNLCPREMVERKLQAVEGTWGKPIWECMPSGPDDAAALNNATHTYLGRLVPLSRLILLQTDGISMLMGAGPVYPNFNTAKTPFLEEPTSTLVLRGKKGEETPTLLRLTPEKALWRELHALTMQRDNHAVGGFWAVQTVNAKKDACHDLVVTGMSRDQAEVIDTLESVYYIPPALHRDDGRAVYEKGVQQAEKTAQWLGMAVEKYRQAVDGGWEGRLKGAGPSKQSLLGLLRKKALGHYWATAEQNLSLLMACVQALGTQDFTETEARWRKTLHAIARDAYRQYCMASTPRQCKAFTLGLNVLVGPKKTVTTAPEEAKQ